MKKNTTLLCIIMCVSLLISINANAQSNDTTFLNTTHVMTSYGQIIANSVTNRLTYKDGNSVVMEEKVVTNMSYPMENGETHVNINTEEFTIIDGEMTFFKGEYNSNDSITVIMGEKDDENFIVSGKLHGESSFQVWDQKKYNKIDAFIVYFDIEKMMLSKKTQTKRMYNLYSINLVKNKLSKLGDEKLSIAGKEFECSMVKFDYGEIKGKLWFTKDKSGNYFLVKEEAQHHENGPFELDLTDINYLKPTKKTENTDGFEF